MASILLAPGTTELGSNAIAVGAGSSAIIFLTTGPDNVPSGTGITVQFQQADTSWINVYTLAPPNMLTALITGPVTFRVWRRAGTTAPVGVDMG